MSSSSGSSSVPSVATTARAAANVNASPPSVNKEKMGLVGWILGLITIIVTITLQLYTLDNGSSGQLAIDSGLNTALWPGLIGVVLLAVGMMTWILLNQNEGYKYPALFMLAFSSYIMANFAMYSSSKQVTVAMK